jgi:hypothetical protein
MPDNDFQERDTADGRVRRCSRLVRVSSAAGDEAGAPSRTGVPVEFRRCDHDVHGLDVYCEKHGETTVPEPSVVSVTSQTLLIEREEIFAYIGGVFANKIGELFYDARARRGRPRKRITNRELILDAVIETQEFIYVHSWEEWLEIKKTLPPSPSWKKHRAELVGRAVALGKVNVAETAKLYDVDRSRPYAWARKASVREWLEKTQQNSPMGREVDSMPLTKADMSELREELQERYEALHADVRATLAIVLEQHPNSTAVAAAVDEFLGDTLRNAD